MTKHNSMHTLRIRLKQIAFIAIKLAIVFGAGFFIYQKLLHNDTLDFEYFLEEAIVFSNMVVIKTIIEELNYNPTLQDTFISVANHYSKRVVKDYLWAIKGFRDNLKISNPDLFNTITIKYNEQKINNF